jgi:hypothetical protein
MWVIPALIIFQLKPMIALLLTGPYLGFLLSMNIHEQPAIWCYTVICQMLLTSNQIRHYLRLISILGSTRPSTLNFTDARPTCSRSRLPNPGVLIAVA